MYKLSAEYYDLIYLAQKDYSKEADSLKHLISRYLNSGGKRLLDIACGTGLHLSHLMDDFQVEGLDLSSEMLEAASCKLPGIPLYTGDMIDFSLPNMYDVIICMFGSIAYTGSRERLHQAFACMARHLAAGGVLLIEPWLSPDLFKPGSIHMQAVDQPDLKIIRMCTSLQRDSFAVLDMHHLVGTPQQTFHFIEHHELALFTLEDIFSAFTGLPLRVHYDPSAVTARGMFMAQKIREIS